MAQKITRWIPHIIYGVLALSVMAPLLLSGYILTLDMAFTPELRMPEHMSSSWLFHTCLHVLNFVIPSQILQKILLFGILFLSGLSMFWLLRRVQQTIKTQNEFTPWGAYLAGALYMINPFTYSRFITGQYAVLLGYALLPLAIKALLDFFAAPSLQRALKVSAWTIIISIVSIHTLGLLAIILLPMFIVFVWRYWSKTNYPGRVIKFGLLSFGAFIIASSYWLIPLLTGASNQGQAVQGFSASDQAAFATAGSNVVAKLGNVLQLQGFWAESYALFLLPQDVAAIWPLAVIIVWAIVGWGLVWLWRHKRPLAIMFSLSALLAIVIALVGTGSWLPGLAGFREPHKFVGVLALVYAMFAGLGAVGIMTLLKEKWDATASGVAAIFIAILPVVFTPTMFVGFNRQLAPRNYPADWTAINQQLSDDPAVRRVLFLPWHLYMHFDFAGRVIVNPADKFFDKPTVISNELEYMGAAPTFPNEEKSKLTKEILPQAAVQTNLGSRLKELGITHVLLAKTFDFESYTYLDAQTDLKLLKETDNLKLYEVTVK